MGAPNYEQWVLMACEECETVYRGDCPKHPYEHARHVPVPLGDVQRPIKTLPDFLYIAPSVQAPDKFGVFTSEVLPSRIVFGPYEGVRVNDTSKITSYTWLLPGVRPPLPADNPGPDQPSYDRPFILDGRLPGEWVGGQYLVDGRPLEQSNWMRYVQAAQYDDEQNLTAFVGYDGHVYYRTRQTIPIGEELIVRKLGPFGWQPYVRPQPEEEDDLPSGVVLCATCNRVRLGSHQRCHECTKKLEKMEL